MEDKKFFNEGYTEGLKFTWITVFHYIYIKDFGRNEKYVPLSAIRSKFTKSGASLHAKQARCLLEL